MLNNFFTVADLNYAIFTLFSTFYLLTIKNKNKNTIHLIVFLMALSSMGVAYFLSSNFIEPFWRFHRWITVSAALVATIHAAYFVMNYPRSTWKKVPKFYLLFAYVIDVFIIIGFIYASLKADRIYKFDGHFWDIDEVFWGQIVGLFILINGIITIICGIIRAFQIRNARIPLLFIVLGFILIVILPGATNLMNRLFLITRDEHQHIWGLFGITGSFILLVTYVNYTKEKTTLLSKLYAISLTSILIILQFVNFFVLQERNQMYDQFHKERNHRVLVDGSFRPKELKYIIKINDDLTYFPIYKQNNIQLPLQNLSSEMAVMLMQKLYLEKKDIPDTVRFYTEGYIKWIEDLEKQYGNTNPQIVLNYIYQNKRKIQLLKRKIERLKEKDFEMQYKEKILKKYKDDPVYKNFLDTNVLYKKEILKHIPIILKWNDRSFDYFEMSGVDFWNQTYVKYYVLYDDSLYLIFYDYHNYRLFISDIADILFYIISIASLLILLGYPVFFLESVLKPLRKLMYGLEKVDQGDFSVSVDITVNDELGYVTRSFNHMVASIREKNQQLEEYANNLEAKVQERTQELEKSLKEIASLKERQDGDYFLTSLLVSPLNSNEIKDQGEIKVDFILRQYKRFHFRKWKAEIGGDFCTAHKIQLRNRQYSFVVNADAMGKSIQGAGGSLILGSVLEAIVERTQYQEEVKELSPEKWLKYSFVELHRVFETLDGAMLVSLVMLLIDEESGFLYFINAEHPDIVLYRNKKADFIKAKKYLRKLGIYSEDFVGISTFQLLPGDILFLGSDGKDDLVLGIHPDGSRNINFDETLFLRVVEESSGKLNLIYENLKERGEFIDDVSIIRIEFSPEEERFREKKIIFSKDKKELYLVKELLQKVSVSDKKSDQKIKKKDIQKANQILIQLREKYPRNLLIRKYLVQCLIKQKKIQEAIQELENMYRFFPEEDQVILQLVRIFKKKKEFSKAVEYGEMYFLRNPDSLEIIEILASLYKEMNHNRYEKYLKLLETMKMV